MTSDPIVIASAVRTPMGGFQGALKALAARDLGAAAIRAAVEKHPWVSEAEVSRVLPDALRILVHEREPVAPWRTPANTIVWVDRDGRSLGELDFNKTDKVPPIISGLEEGAGEAHHALAAQHRRRHFNLARPVFIFRMRLRD